MIKVEKTGRKKDLTCKESENESYNDYKGKIFSHVPSSNLEGEHPLLLGCCSELERHCLISHNTYLPLLEPYLYKGRR